MKGFLSKALPNPGYHGWRVVAVGLAATALSGPGQSFLISFFIDGLIEDVGVSRVEIATLYALATAGAALCLPLVGRIADRVTGRVFLVTVLGGLGLLQLGLSQASAGWQVAVTFFGLRLLGQGSIGLGVATEVVRWFHRYRPRALAMSTLGYAVGEFVFPPVVVAAIAAAGWRPTLAVLGVAYLLLFAPLTALPLRRRDPDREPLDGGEVEGAPPGGAAARRAAAEAPSLTVRQAMRTRAFWQLGLGAAAAPLVITAIIFHLAVLFRLSGWSPAWAAVTLMAYALASVGSTYATGLLLERVPSRWGLVAANGMLGLGAGVPLLGLSGIPAAAFFGAVLGLAAGVNGAANGQVWPDYFGVGSMGAIRGVTTMFRNGGAALGPPLLAPLLGSEGALGWAVALLATIALVAAGVSALAPPAEGS